MIGVFIDTNIYEELGYNFDERNIILKTFIDLTKNKEIKNIMISVIDNEVKNHIENRIEENKRKIKKHCKWINDIVAPEIVEKNIYKELNDFENFKINSNTEIVTIENINPEIVFKKFFDVTFPFEKSKPNEFKDAFIIEAILKYIENSYCTKFIVVTKDKGVKEAFKKHRTIY